MKSWDSETIVFGCWMVIIFLAAGSGALALAIKAMRWALS